VQPVDESDDILVRLRDHLEVEGRGALRAAEGAILLFGDDRGDADAQDADSGREIAFDLIEQAAPGEGFAGEQLARRVDFTVLLG